MIKKNPYGKRVDLWACGKCIVVLVYYHGTGDLVYHHDMGDLVYHHGRGDVVYHLDNRTP